MGMHHRKIPKQVKGAERYILRSYPSTKAMKKMKEKVKEVTEPRNRLFWTMNQSKNSIRKFRDEEITMLWIRLPISDVVNW